MRAVPANCPALIGIAAMVAALTGAQAGAPEPDPVALFTEACLDQLPDFAGTPDAFEGAGWAETPAPDDIKPARLFGAPGGSLGMVETGIEGADGPVATCTLVLEPQPPENGATDRVAAAVAARGASLAPADCTTLGGVRACFWLWPQPGGCGSAVVTVSHGRLASLMATSMETELDCHEALQ